VEILRAITDRVCVCVCILNPPLKYAKSYNNNPTNLVKFERSLATGIIKSNLGVPFFPKM